VCVCVCMYVYIYMWGLFLVSQESHLNSRRLSKSSSSISCLVSSIIVMLHISTALVSLASKQDGWYWFQWPCPNTPLSPKAFLEVDTCWKCTLAEKVCKGPKLWRAELGQFCTRQKATSILLWSANTVHLANVCYAYNSCNMTLSFEWKNQYLFLLLATNLSFNVINFKTVLAKINCEWGLPELILPYSIHSDRNAILIVIMEIDNKFFPSHTWKKYMWVIYIGYILK